MEVKGCWSFAHSQAETCGCPPRGAAAAVVRVSQLDAKWYLTLLVCIMMQYAARLRSADQGLEEEPCLCLQMHRFCTSGSLSGALTMGRGTRSCASNRSGRECPQRDDSPVSGSSCRWIRVKREGRSLDK
eukprot:3349223-Amphidinium_carterae.2